MLLAVGAAVLFALTSVLQHAAAVQAPQDRSLRPGLLLDLVRRPLWLLGNLAEVGAIAVQFVALRQGSLVLVQTVLVSGLLFALPMGAALQHRRLATADWAGTLAVVAGLGLFVVAGQPGPGRAEPSGLAWAVVLAVGCGLVAALIALAPWSPGGRRATNLGGACGVLFGVNAALAKACGHLLDRGFGVLLRSWEPYTLLALGAFGFLLSQSAFQAGPLAASLPLITAADPLAAAAIGVLAFDEHLRGGAMAHLGQVVSVGAITAGIWLLARSPLVAGDPGPPATVAA